MKALIINYGVGNLFSIYSGLRRIGFDVLISNEPKEGFDLIVLPGVGSFSAVTSYLSKYYNQLNEFRKSGTAFLGVCLGMQVMFEYGTEGGLSRGLGWIKGKVDKIDADVKLPHIGWDKLYLVKEGCELTEGLNNNYVYYVHSYVAYPGEDVTYMKSKYGIEYPALVCKDNLIGTQFHPEKSGDVGKRFLENLARWLRR